MSKESEIADIYLSRRRGFLDGVNGKIKSILYLHSNKHVPDNLKVSYDLGYNDGNYTRIEYTNRIAEELGYKPNILRTKDEND